jgi:hypothetical protein
MKTFTAFVIALSALLFAPVAAQAQTTVGLHLVSHHFPERPGQRNFNPGVYVRTADGWTAGYYRNTLGRNSVYAGYTLEHSFTSYLSVGVTAGAVTGYRLNDDGYGVAKSALTPMLAPSVKVGPARLSFIPGIGVSASVVHLSVEATL